MRGLWRHPDFLKFWFGQSVSLLGSQITVWALPLLADVGLRATPAQMGILTAAGYAPFLLASLFAGAWVDRLPRRRVMILADVGRALLLGLIPLAAGFGVLRLEQLYLVAFCAGLLTLFFDTAYQAYLPSLVEREQLMEGNSKLAVTLSTAETAGPMLAPALVRLLTAPVAIALDAASFLVSALCLWRIRKPESPPPPAAAQSNVWREIAEGLRVIGQSPLLRAVAASAFTLNFFGGVYDALAVVYVTRELRLDPALVGLKFLMGSLSGIFVALWAERIARRAGLGPAIMLGALGIGVAAICVPLAGGPAWLALAVLAVSGLVGGAGNMTYNVTLTSLAQSLVPGRLLGRYNASLNFFALGLLPLGSLIGGWLGETIGLRPTMAISALGSITAFLWILFSPLRTLDRVEQAQN
jgi:MFS family permease